MNKYIVITKYFTHPKRKSVMQSNNILPLPHTNTIKIRKKAKQAQIGGHDSFFEKKKEKKVDERINVLC